MENLTTATSLNNSISTKEIVQEKFLRGEDVIAVMKLKIKFNFIDFSMRYVFF